LSCGATVNFLKEWKYHNNYYQVRMYKCSKCTLKFREYYHDGRLSHTIPKFVSTKKRVIVFLRHHESATVEIIANALCLDAKEVIEVLISLRDEGRLECII
jgi:hypothetical protein